LTVLIVNHIKILKRIGLTLEYIDFDFQIFAFESIIGIPNKKEHLLVKVLANNLAHEWGILINNN